MHYITWILLAAGVFSLLSSSVPGIYTPARRALRARAAQNLTKTQVLQNSVAAYLEPLLHIDPLRRDREAQLLRNLGHTESVELFHARAIAYGLTVSALCAVSMVLSVPIGLCITLLSGVLAYRNQLGTPEHELRARREQIECELPQLANTIAQSLATTRDVPTILKSYRRIASTTLSGELDKTLNDMLTGNAERALRALEARVLSPQLDQITRGLLAVLHGEEQRQYFHVLAVEFRKTQSEQMERELLARPKKLYPYMAILFVFLLLMMGASMGVDLIESLKTLF